MIHHSLTGLILLPLWLATAGPENPPRPDAGLGKSIYRERCQVCHGTVGNGKSFAANVLNPPPKNFTAPDSRQQLTLKRMIDSATHGRPGTAMMPWKEVLSPDEIRAVVHYIRTELMGVGP